MANASLAFAALADPTRREIFERIARAPSAVGDLANVLPVSRPAVSQHLKVLKDAGLVVDRAEGARRVYEIDPQGLGPIRAWLDQFWGIALDAFKAEVEKDDGGASNSVARTSATNTNRTGSKRKRKGDRS